MNLEFTKVASILERIKTPLTLGGLVVMVLYALYSQVLKLPGFAAALPSGAAAQLIGDVIKYLFWLAILAVILGVGSYLAVHFFPKGWLPDPDKPVALKVNHKTRKSKANLPGNSQSR